MRKTVAFGFVGTVLDYAGAAVSAGRNGFRHSVYASKNRWSSIDWNYCMTPARARYLKRLNAISPAFRQKQKW